MGRVVFSHGACLGVCHTRATRTRAAAGRGARRGARGVELSAVSGGRQHGGIVQVNIDNLNGRAVILA